MPYQKTGKGKSPGRPRGSGKRMRHRTPFSMEPERIDDLLEADLHGDDEELPEHYTVQKEKPIHRSMALARAQGCTVAELAEFSGYSTAQCYKLCRQPWFNKMVLRVQAKRGMTMEEQINSYGRTAAENLYRLANEAESENVRVTANMNLLDRITGKPVQRVASISATLSEESLSDPRRVNEELQQLDVQLKELAKKREALSARPAGEGKAPAGHDFTDV